MEFSGRNKHHCTQDRPAEERRTSPKDCSKTKCLLTDDSSRLAVIKIRGGIQSDSLSP